MSDVTLKDKNNRQELAGDLTYDNGLVLGTFKLLAAGSLIISEHAAVADAALAAGDCQIWFDQTNGAAKLMAKAKTANGTVVTAAVALA